MNVVDIRKQFMELYDHDEGRVGNTIEIVGASFIADEPTIFGKPNEDYIARELEWYMSGSRYVHDIPGDIPKIWKQVAAKDGMVNSNYGWLVYDRENWSQYEHVLETLLKSPNGRRGTMVYTRPSIQVEWNINGMTDFICTNAVNYFVRDNQVHAVVQMRSNDVVFGYRNDYAWQKYVLENLVEDMREENVDVTAGTIIWQAASLHVYERHFDLIQEAIDEARFSGEA